LLRQKWKNKQARFTISDSRFDSNGLREFRWTSNRPARLVEPGAFSRDFARGQAGRIEQWLLTQAIHLPGSGILHAA
jgi:hypothetical protein